MSIKIFPSLIDADLLNLEHVINRLDPVCQGFHIDVMDNHYVPNLTWGPAFINAIARVSTNRLEIHLMVDNPMAIVERCRLRRGDIITIHADRIELVKPFFASLRQEGLHIGLAFSPDSSFQLVSSYRTFPIDWVLLMSVKPGFSGQSLLPDSLERLQALITYRAEHNLSFTIAMDGGINEQTIASCVRAGCDTFAVGSAIFSKVDPQAAVQQLRAAAQV